MRRPPRSPLAAATLLGAALLLSACGSAPTGRLLVVRGDVQSPKGVQIVAVDPGHPTRPGDAVANGVTGAAQIRVVTDGAVRTDNLATTWDGQALVAAVLGSTTKVTATRLGDRPRTLSSTGEARVTVVERGVLVEAAEGCTLTPPDGRTQKFGTGRCTISQDGRWLATWPAQGGTLKVHDLRHGTVRAFTNLKVSESVVAIGRDNLVAAEVAVGTGARIVLVDAATGDVVGRSPVAQAIAGLNPKSEGAPGAVVTVRTTTGAELWFMDADGTTTVIDQGALLIPVSTRGAVTYLRYDAQFQKGAAVRRNDDGTLDTILRGVVGAGPAGSERIVLTRERRGATEFFTTGTTGGEVRSLVTARGTTAAPTGATAAVAESFLTDGNRTWVVLTNAGAQSLVRLDLVGDESAVVLSNWQLVRLVGIDADGTALVAGARSVTPTPGGVGGGRLLTVRPDADEPEDRLATQNAAALLRDGRIYLTGTRQVGGEVRTDVRVLDRGRSTTRVLFRGTQLAGALWPAFGESTESTLVTPGLVLQQAQQAGGGGG